MPQCADLFNTLGERRRNAVVQPDGASAAFVALLLLLCTSLPVLAQERMAELTRRFDGERDPVRRAQLFPRLGEAHFELMRQKTQAGDYGQAVAILNMYVDAVEKLCVTLQAAVSDPEKHPSGFKELESHLRKSIRSLDDTVNGLPIDQRGPFQVDRHELEMVHEKLIQELFPRQPKTGWNIAY